MYCIKNKLTKEYENNAKIYKTKKEAIYDMKKLKNKNELKIVKIIPWEKGMFELFERDY